MTDSATTSRTGIDKRLIYAIALSGVTLAMAVGNAVRSPEPIPITTVVSLAVVFLFLTVRELPRRASE